MCARESLIDVEIVFEIRSSHIYIYIFVYVCVCVCVYTVQRTTVFIPLYLNILQYIYICVYTEYSYVR